ncbi:MAG TPA: type III pantothenate kinase [Pyrinomonadaceae bacterium]|nr:type III pantothenate kinase [Pyrinomonadaceae bacterium]
MLLTIDIGNSSIKFGVFGPEALVDKFVIPTARDYDVDELLFDRLRVINDRFFEIDSIIVSSVVPEIDETLAAASLELLRVKPRFVDHSFDLGLKIKYTPPDSVGTDRLVNASAAALLYGTPVIVCSFGTATTIDVVTDDNEFIGGAIAPGMKTMTESLSSSTSKLPAVSIEWPSSAIGDSTESSIRSGIFYGQIGLAEGIIGRFVKELGSKPKIVATGGFAVMIGRETTIFDVIDENLTLEGLRLIAHRNGIE